MENSGKGGGWRIKGDEEGEGRRGEVEEEGGKRWCWREEEEGGRRRRKPKIMLKRRVRSGRKEYDVDNDDKGEEEEKEEIWKLIRKGGMENLQSNQPTSKTTNHLKEEGKKEIT